MSFSKNWWVIIHLDEVKECSTSMKDLNFSHNFFFHLESVTRCHIKLA